MRKAVCAAAMFLAALWVFCGAETAELTGDWHGTFYGMAVTLTLEADGTYALTISAYPEDPMRGDWAPSETGVVLDPDTPGASALKWDGQNLVMHEGEDTLSFTRDRAAGFTPAAPVAADGAETLAGTWSGSVIGLNGAYMDGTEPELIVTARIEGTTLTLDGYAFSGQTFACTFAEGALRCDATREAFQSIAAELLEDGLLRLTLMTESENRIEFFLEREN